MGIQVSVKVRKNPAWPPHSYREALQTLAAEWVREIRTRTRGGRAETGRFFKGYAKATRKRGRVSLYETGQMQRALRVIKVRDRGVEIGVTDPRQKRKAVAHQYGVPSRNLPPRPWSNLSKRQIKAGVKRIITVLNKTKASGV